MRDAPFAPLINGGDALRRRAGETDRLRRRMADLYAVDEENILPVRGRAHGFELAFRMLARDGGTVCTMESSPTIAWLARLYGVAFASPAEASVLFAAQSAVPSAPSMEADGRRLLILDESEIEFCDSPSLSKDAVRSDGVAVIRSLELSFGLGGAPCGAIVANAALVRRLAMFVEPDALPPVICQAALAALDPMRMAATKARISFVKSERERIAAALMGAKAERGPSVVIEAGAQSPVIARLREFGICAERLCERRIRLPIGTGEENDRLLAAFGAAPDAGRVRRGEAVRETKETKIVAIVDLDREGGSEIDTGVGFFDHMIMQIAHHAGVSVALSCKGDLEIDAHHTIEDCAIAFGAALSDALGERRGIARFGFTLPMDEAQAQISIDLGGRPYLVFDGEFSNPSIGEYPTQMSEHVFRSLSQSLGAAIHLRVTGENDHHKTEACFKAFGRALRQAVRIEGDTTPSTKGAIL
ncbi:MAG: imidazoleglycerol-phosphate dehydratase HisB [Parvularculaceae bacterium]|nr:imidazoleglycerol-phosphate dehydratase HisB [Parvularculaceae bacterium]